MLANYCSVLITMVSSPLIGLLLLICMLKAGETLLAHSWSVASCLLVCTYAVLHSQW